MKTVKEESIVSIDEESLDAEETRKFLKLRLKARRTPRFDEQLKSKFNESSQNRKESKGKKGEKTQAISAYMGKEMLRLQRFHNKS